MRQLTLDDADILWSRMRRIYAISTPVVDVVEKPWGNRLEIATDERAPLCPGGARLKRRCTNMAGWRSAYKGVGVCNKHDHGVSAIGTAGEGLLIMAHAFSNPSAIRPTAISPQMALLEELSRTVNGVRWLDKKVATAKKDIDLLIEEGELGQFVAMRERERAHLVRVANAAVNSRAVELVQEQNNEYAAQVIGMLSRFVEQAELDADQKLAVNAFIKGELLAVDDVIEIET